MRRSYNGTSAARSECRHRTAAQRSAAQGLLTDGTDATTSSSSSSPAAASTGFGALKAIA